MMNYRMILPGSMLLIGIMAYAGTADAFSWFSRSGTREPSRAQLVANGKSEKQKLKSKRIRGTVERVTDQVAYVHTSDGRIMAVQLGPTSYWEAQGYRLVPGRRVTVVGWYDPYTPSDLFFAMSISGPGFSYALTNRVGAPLWITDYEYERGWYPTHRVYEGWYGPTYHYVPPGHMKGAPPGHVKGAPPGHTKSTPANKRGDKSHGGPRGK